METNQNDWIQSVSCIKNVEEYYFYAFGMVATRQGHVTACWFLWGLYHAVELIRSCHRNLTPPIHATQI